MSKKIRPFTDEERQRAKEREEANSNNKEKNQNEYWPDNPVDCHAI